MRSKLCRRGITGRPIDTTGFGAYSSAFGSGNLNIVWAAITEVGGPDGRWIWKGWFLTEVLTPKLLACMEENSGSGMGTLCYLSHVSLANPLTACDICFMNFNLAAGRTGTWSVNVAVCPWWAVYLLSLVKPPRPPFVFLYMCIL